MTLEQLAAMVAIGLGAMSLGRALVRVGELLRRLDDLESRHREGITDTRTRLAALERHALPPPQTPAPKG